MTLSNNLATRVLQTHIEEFAHKAFKEVQAGSVLLEYCQGPPPLTNHVFLIGIHSMQG